MRAGCGLCIGWVGVSVIGDMRYMSVKLSELYLKSEWNRKKGRGNKKFKKTGQAGSRSGCLIKVGGGLEPFYEL